MYHNIQIHKERTFDVCNYVRVLNTWLFLDILSLVTYFIRIYALKLIIESDTQHKNSSYYYTLLKSR